MPINYLVKNYYLIYIVAVRLVHNLPLVNNDDKNNYYFCQFHESKISGNCV